jgi:hypothetical protein
MPLQVEASRDCTGACHGRNGHRVPGGRIGTGCPERPRCRWRLVGGVVPCRLLVSLAESHRVDGGIRQEHIADLGAIEEHWVPGVVPETPVHWLLSVAVRSDFWVALDERLARLSNRLCADQVGPIRGTVQQRIPRPTDDEVAQVAAYRWTETQAGFEAAVEKDRAEIARLEREIATGRADIAVLQPIVDHMAEGPVEGQIAAEYGPLTTLLGRIMWRRAKIGGWG